MDSICFALFAVLLGLVWPISGSAQIMLDVFGTRGDLASLPTYPGPAAICPGGLPTAPLTMVDAVTRALCNSPVTQKAFAMARSRTAQVGVAKAAYLPTVNGTLGAERDQTAQTYDYSGFPSITQRAQGNAKYGSLDLNWVLFDFGQRSATLKNAKQLMLAAYANYDDALQTAFADAAQAYLDAATAAASLEAARLAQDMAQQVQEAASAKHQAGAGTLADELQAETAYSKAVLSRVTEEGKFKTAEGKLAIMMGFDADTPLALASQDSPPADAYFLDAIDSLITEAQQQHPKLRAARASLDAARSQVDVAREQGLPTVSLTGSLSRNNPVDQQTANTSLRERVIGIQISIPLFEGFARGYRIEDAQAQAKAAEADLADAERQVAEEVWSSYQALISATGSLNETKTLVKIAGESLRVARGRYRAGVGTIIELLNAQSAAADAQQEQVHSFAMWRSARLKLAESLGQLGFWSVQ
ncbi:TolC family protein [Trinickia sp. YCB016]